MSNCTNCSGRCYFITVKCLLGEATLLNSSIDADVLRSFIEQAQKRYLKDLLGDCYEELCTAIQKSELDVGDPDYEVLSSKWVSLIEEVRYLVAVGAEYLYVKRKGFAVLRNSGLQKGNLNLEEFTDIRQTLGSEVKASRNDFEIWLKSPQSSSTTALNSALYDCLPSTTVCDDEPDDGFNWDVIGRC